MLYYEILTKLKAYLKKKKWTKKIDVKNVLLDNELIDTTTKMCAQAPSTPIGWWNLSFSFFSFMFYSWENIPVDFNMLQILNEHFKLTLNELKVHSSTHTHTNTLYFVLRALEFYWIIFYYFFFYKTINSTTNRNKMTANKFDELKWTE